MSEEIVSLPHDLVPLPALMCQYVNEVDLLLDFIAGRPDKNLSDLDPKLVGEINDNNQSFVDVLKKYYSIRETVGYDKPSPIEAVAFVLSLKDLLNQFVGPTRSLNIAFTTMSTVKNPDLDSSRLEFSRNAFPGLVSSANWFRKFKTALGWAGILFTFVCPVAMACFLRRAACGTIRYCQNKRCRSGNKTLQSDRLREIASELNTRSPNSLPHT